MSNPKVGFLILTEQHVRLYYKFIEQATNPVLYISLSPNNHRYAQLEALIKLYLRDIKFERKPANQMLSDLATEKLAHGFIPCSIITHDDGKQVHHPIFKGIFGAGFLNYMKKRGLFNKLSTYHEAIGWGVHRDDWHFDTKYIFCRSMGEYARHVKQTSGAKPIALGDFELPFRFSIQECPLYRTYLYIVGSDGGRVPALKYIPDSFWTAPSFATSREPTPVRRVISLHPSTPNLADVIAKFINHMKSLPLGDSNTAIFESTLCPEELLVKYRPRKISVFNSYSSLATLAQLLPTQRFNTVMFVGVHPGDVISQQIRAVDPKAFVEGVKLPVTSHRLVKPTLSGSLVLHAVFDSSIPGLFRPARKGDLEPNPSEKPADDRWDIFSQTVLAKASTDT